jgi:hypothetical protein
LATLQTFLETEINLRATAQAEIESKIVACEQAEADLARQIIADLAGITAQQWADRAHPAISTDITGWCCTVGGGRGISDGNRGGDRGGGGEGGGGEGGGDGGGGAKQVETVPVTVPEMVVVHLQTVPPLTWIAAPIVEAVFP